MNKKIEKGILYVDLPERIDFNNSDAFGDEIVSAITDEVISVVLNARILVYISSAGLRQVLRIKKMINDFSIINTSVEAYDIFQITGFTEMMDIKKEYRQIDITNAQKIGEGSNGIVYRISPDEIVKVYKNDDVLEDIKREIALARKALILGINTAIQKDVVKVGDKYGVIFELLSSNSIANWIRNDPDNFDKYITVYVELLHNIHQTIVTDPLFPSVNEVELERRYDLKGVIDDEHYNKLIKLFKEIPESDCMVHGDYHVGNVHYDLKDTILIDMDTLSHGNIIFDFASMYTAYQGFSIVDHDAVGKFLKIDFDTASKIWKSSVSKYFEKEDITDIENKAKVISLSRILRRTIRRDPNNIELIEASKKGLYEALDSIDNLII